MMWSIQQSQGIRYIFWWLQFIVGNYLTPESNHHEMVTVPMPSAMAGLNVLALCFKLSNCYGTNCARMHPCQITAPSPSQKPQIASRKMSDGPPTLWRTDLTLYDNPASVWTLRRKLQMQVAGLQLLADEGVGWMGGRMLARDHNWIQEHFLLFNHCWVRNKY